MMIWLSRAKITSSKDLIKEHMWLFWCGPVLKGQPALGKRYSIILGMRMTLKSLCSSLLRLSTSLLRWG